jgi:hypothetical protein
VVNAIIESEDYENAMLLGYRGLEYGKYRWKIDNNGPEDKISVSIIHKLLEYKDEKEFLIEAMTHLKLPLETRGRVCLIFFPISLELCVNGI